MLTHEDLESYLIRMDVDYEGIAEGMFLVRAGDERLPVVVHHSPPTPLPEAESHGSRAGATRARRSIPNAAGA